MRILKKPTVIVIFIIIVLTILFFPYIKSEYLTLKYGKEFEGLEKQTNMLSDSSYYKVLDYSENKARVFYVSDSGDIIVFQKNPQGEWIYQSWDTIWSKSGSADGFMWPYYR